MLWRLKYSSNNQTVIIQALAGDPTAAYGCIMGDSQQRAIVLMSGGIDSTACAHFLRENGFAVAGLFIDHGQAASKQEERAVVSLSHYLGLRIDRFSLQGSEPFGTGELIGRNAFLVFAALLLTRGQSNLLALGLHAGTPYYDCSPEFIDTVSRFVAEHTDGRVGVTAPFVSWTKKDVYEYFSAANMPLEITYSCEAGTEPSCGVCLSCRDRKALGC